MPSRKSRWIAALLVAVATLAAQAEDVESPIDFAIRQQRWQDAQRLVDARLKADPADPLGLYGQMELAIDDHTGSAEQRRKLLPRLEACVAAKPTAMLCQLAYANVLGVEAINAGMVSGLRAVGKIKDAYLAAVALDPTSYEARQSLVQFYLMAPGIAGGSVKEAKRHTEAFANIDPQRGHLLRAQVAMYESDYGRAEAALKSIPTPQVGTLLRRQINDVWISLGYAYVHDKQYAAANAVFERASHEDDNWIVAAAHFGLGRSALAQEQLDTAVNEFTRAMSLDHGLNGHYRLAKALEKKGDKPHAIAEYEAYLHFTPEPVGDMVDEARKRLVELRS